MRSTYVSYSSRSAAASPATTRAISSISVTELRNSLAASSIVDLLTPAGGKGLSIAPAARLQPGAHFSCPYNDKPLDFREGLATYRSADLSYFRPSRRSHAPPARPRAYSAHHLPAAGPPPQVPSDSPGVLTQRNASTSGFPVRVAGTGPTR